MKNNIFIIGDSYSTYEGYIPEGYHFYYSDERKENPIVKGVEKTWWNMLANENNLNIILNDSFSGSTICNTVRETYDVESSFVSRIDKYIAKNFFNRKQDETTPRNQNWSIFKENGNRRICYISGRYRHKRNE